MTGQGLIWLGRRVRLLEDLVSIQLFDYMYYSLKRSR